MAHEDLGRGTEVQPGSERSFGFVFAIVFAVVAYWRPVGGTAWAVAWAVAAVAILAVGLARPAWLRVPNRLWFRFGMMLSLVVSPVVLGLLFFVVVTPVGLLMRAFGKRSAAFADPPPGASLWVLPPPGADPVKFDQQY